MALPVALVIVAFYLFRQPRQGGRETNALDILKERYARGEIGKDEFEQKDAISAVKAVASRRAEGERDEA